MSAPSSGDAGVRVIDLHHLGRESVIACMQVGDVLIDPGPSSCLPTLLEALGDDVPRAILLTHIHLDHAGASGSLCRCWPDVEVYVHERGARHMADPEKLIASATRLYGEDMHRLWGDFVAVPPERMRILRGGERILENRFEVAYTPGHASHHVSYHNGNTAFVGDTGGVRIRAGAPAIPPTPPPDIDLEAWRESIALIAAWRPARLAITHFGLIEEPEPHLRELTGRLDTWGQAAREQDRDTFIAGIRRELEMGTDEATVETYLQTAPLDQIQAGLARYWSKRSAA